MTLKVYLHPFDLLPTSTPDIDTNLRYRPQYIGFTHNPTSAQRKNTIWLVENLYQFNQQKLWYRDNDRHLITGWFPANIEYLLRQEPALYTPTEYVILTLSNDVEQAVQSRSPVLVKLYKTYNDLFPYNNLTIDHKNHEEDKYTWLLDSIESQTVHPASTQNKKFQI